MELRAYLRINEMNNTTFELPVDIRDLLFTTLLTTKNTTIYKHMCAVVWCSWFHIVVFLVVNKMVNGRSRIYAVKWTVNKAHSYQWIASLLTKRTLEKRSIPLINVWINSSLIVLIQLEVFFFRPSREKWNWHLWQQWQQCCYTYSIYLIMTL